MCVCVRVCDTEDTNPSEYADRPSVGPICGCSFSRNTMTGKWWAGGSSTSSNDRHGPWEFAPLPRSAGRGCCPIVVLRGAAG